MKLTPLIPLDDPSLKHGPYSDEQFQTGHIAIGDCGLLYGYTYRPARFTGDEDGVVAPSCYHPSKTVNGRLELGSPFPWCSTAEEAIEFLKAHGYYGHVTRYCLDERVLRDEWEEVILLAGMKPTRRKVTPWITAGIVAIVNAPSETTFHAHLTAIPKSVHVRSADFVSKGS